MPVPSIEDYFAYIDGELDAVKTQQFERYVDANRHAARTLKRIARLEDRLAENLILSLLHEGHRTRGAIPASSDATVSAVDALISQRQASVQASRLDPGGVMAEQLEQLENGGGGVRALPGATARGGSGRRRGRFALGWRALMTRLIRLLRRSRARRLRFVSGDHMKPGAQRELPSRDLNAATVPVALASTPPTAEIAPVSRLRVQDLPAETLAAWIDGCLTADEARALVATLDESDTGATDLLRLAGTVSRAAAMQFADVPLGMTNPASEPAIPRHSTSAFVTLDELGLDFDRDDGDAARA